MQILVSRIQRYLKNDTRLPKHCYNKWFFNDVYVDCKCKDECIYKKYTLKQWFEYSDKLYEEYVKKLN